MDRERRGEENGIRCDGRAISRAGGRQASGLLNEETETDIVAVRAAAENRERKKGRKKRESGNRTAAIFFCADQV